MVRVAPVGCPTQSQRKGVVVHLIAGVQWPANPPKSGTCRSGIVFSSWVNFPSQPPHNGADEWARALALQDRRTTMSKDTINKPVQNPVQLPDANAEVAAKIAADKAAILKAAVAAEVAKIKAAKQALIDAILATGPQGLQALAVEVGESVGANGKPRAEEYSVLQDAIRYRETDFKEVERLCATAKRSVSRLVDPVKISKFTTGKGTGKVGKIGASCSVTMVLPEGWKIAIGE